MRQKSLLIDKHVMMRAMNRLNFRKVEDVFMSGEIIREGRTKYRAVLPVKGGKIAYVIFQEHPDFLEFKTCGISSERRGRG